MLPEVTNTMQTITFYSYKGGVGRTLIMANVAKYLAMFGKKVFCLDFDIEAPGLHYKLMIDQVKSAKQIEKGVVDFIHSFAVLEEMPTSLEGYVHEIITSTETGGSVHLMPAGRAPSVEYWLKLSRIKWHDLFYYDSDTGNKEHDYIPPGVPFFLEFKEMIRKEYNPDFLLIDSRTGVTEIGGVATTLLPDKIVCLLINNPENLEGVREVLRAIKRTPRLEGQTPAEIIPVLTRIPITIESDIKQTIIKHTKEFLSEESDSLLETLNIDKIMVFHSDPELEKNESIYIGSNKTSKDVPLLRDYLVLCNKLVTDDSLQQGLKYLLGQISEKMLLEGQPKKRERELEQLWDYRHHKDVYTALNNFYNIRETKGFKPVKIAIEYRTFIGIGKEFDDIVIKTVCDNRAWLFEDSKVPEFREFIDVIVDVWFISGEVDDDFDKKIIEYYISVYSLSNDYLWKFIKKHLKYRAKSRLYEIPGFLKYVMQYWESDGCNTFEVLYWMLGNYRHGVIRDTIDAAKLILKVNDSGSRLIINFTYLCNKINELVIANEFDLAIKLINKFKLYPEAEKSNFQITWAKLLIAMNNRQALKEAHKDGHFKMKTIEEVSPEIYNTIIENLEYFEF